MENTLENKAKFFAQYWGQKVLSDGIEIGGCVGDCEENLFLELKPISSITDEDMEFIRPLIGYNNTPDGISLVKRWLTVLWMDVDDVSFFAMADSKPTLRVLKTIDYLRSKSYALPYMNLSVETMIEYGWVKLS